jgi:hypothetical protein
VAEQESKQREARVVVALREKRSGRLWVGEPWEQHPDVRRRHVLGARTAGWLVDGFVDLDTGEFLTRGQAARRWPDEAGRTFGRGTADSSDFAAIRRAKLERAGRRDRAQESGHE